MISKLLCNEIIVRINWWNDFRGVVSKQFPHDECVELICLLVRMEAINGFNQLPCLASLPFPVLKCLLYWRVKIVRLQVGECFIGNQLSECHIQCLGMLSGSIAPRLIVVQPSKTGRNVQTVHIVVKL